MLLLYYLYIGRFRGRVAGVASPLWSDNFTKKGHFSIFRGAIPPFQTQWWTNMNRDFYLGIESHFVGVHRPYELHRKEKQIECTALAVHENLLFFPMQFIWPVNTDKMPFNTYIYIFLQQSLSRYCLL